VLHLLQHGHLVVHHLLVAAHILLEDDLDGALAVGPVCFSDNAVCAGAEGASEVVF
jgi:hypothetical protein